MYEDLSIIHYPDPRLKAVSEPATVFDAALRELSLRMFDLMRKHKGVGLAAAQVGKNVRLFVTNPTGKPEDDRIYVNPILLDLDGEETGEEGCLSLPKVNVPVVRALSARLQAFDVEGNPFELVDTGYLPRIWQHEFDHLNGVMLLDRMGPMQKIAHRRALNDMQEAWDEAHPPPPKPAKKPARSRRK